MPSCASTATPMSIDSERIARPPIRRAAAFGCSARAQARARATHRAQGPALDRASRDPATPDRDKRKGQPWRAAASNCAASHRPRRCESRSRLPPVCFFDSAEEILQILDRDPAGVAAPGDCRRDRPASIAAQPCARAPAAKDSPRLSRPRERAARRLDRPGNANRPRPAAGLFHRLGNASRFRSASAPLSPIPLRDPGTSFATSPVGGCGARFWKRAASASLAST